MKNLDVPSWDKISRLAPITVIIVCLAGVVFYTTKTLTDEHIESLKEFNRYLQGQIEKTKNDL